MRYWVLFQLISKTFCVWCFVYLHCQLWGHVSSVWKYLDRKLYKETTHHKCKQTYRTWSRYPSDSRKAELKHVDFFFTKTGQRFPAWLQNVLFLVVKLKDLKLHRDLSDRFVNGSELTVRASTNQRKQAHCSTNHAQNQKKYVTCIFPRLAPVACLSSERRLVTGTIYACCDWPDVLTQVLVLNSAQIHVFSHWFALFCTWKAL